MVYIHNRRSGKYANNLYRSFRTRSDRWDPDCDEVHSLVPLHYRYTQPGERSPFLGQLNRLNECPGRSEHAWIFESIKVLPTSGACSRIAPKEELESKSQVCVFPRAAPHLFAHVWLSTLFRLPVDVPGLIDSPWRS